MYEDTKFKSNINWKSLLIKLGILLLIVFLICFIVFRPKKDNSFISLESNITSVKEAAIIYYQNNLTAKEIGDYQKVTLKELVANELIEEQEDEEGNICNTKKSYAYLTKTRDDEFVLKINMICGDNKDSEVYNVTTEDLTIVATKEEEIKVEEEVTEPSIKEEIIEEDKEIADNSSDKKKEDNNTTHIDFDNDELVEELHNPNSTKKIYYKHIKYGEWTEGNKYGFNIETSTKEVYYYNYCYDNNCILDRLDNAVNYEGYTATYSHSETVSIYRYVYVVWSTSSCIKGLTNTGIVEYR